MPTVLFSAMINPFLAAVPWKKRKGHLPLKTGVKHRVLGNIYGNGYFYSENGVLRYEDPPVASSIHSGDLTSVRIV